MLWIICSQGLIIYIDGDRACILSREVAVTPGYGTKSCPCCTRSVHIYTEKSRSRALIRLFLKRPLIWRSINHPIDPFQNHSICRHHNGAQDKQAYATIQPNHFKDRIRPESIVFEALLYPRPINKR